MKVFLLIFLYIGLINESHTYSYVTKYYKQKVDHFGYLNQDTYLQRYFINHDYFNPRNGTIFFYTGNEGDLETFSNNSGFIWETAPQFNALVVFAEHRYYGKSLPFGDKSLKNPYQSFLTSEQALADFAYLITHLRSSIPGAETAPLFAFGGSYGGMLSAWIRMKYPHLVHGAIASSAPILQFLTPCEKFYEVVTQDFAKANSNCPKSIRKSWSILRKFASTECGAKFLTKTFNLCKPVNDTNVAELINWLSGTWTDMAMTDYPYPTDFLKPIPAYPIDAACKYLKNSSVSDKELVMNIYNAVSVFQNYSGSVKCFNLNDSEGSRLGVVGWNFQACTEMVMPMCQTGTTDMFEPEPWNFTAFSDECWKSYKVRPDLYKALIMYGGRNITDHSNIIFTNGKLDPWHTGGVLKSLSPSLIAIFMEDTAHHLDLRESNRNDPSSVQQARAEIKSWIRKWSAETRSRQLHR